MIGFSRLGYHGRFGNQLFQYAFLRFHSRRLGTQFFCPEWEGDRVFTLHDSSERAITPQVFEHIYEEPAYECGYHSDALEIIDGTDILGWFQSDKYFDDPEEVREWYTFNESIREVVERLPFSVDSLRSAISFSIRLDDDYSSLRFKHPLYSVSYYQDALRLLPGYSSVLIFSDRPDRARDFFRGSLFEDACYIDRLDRYQQMHLMGRCAHHVITNSTFAWWGAWLNRSTSKVVVVPKSWFTPGSPWKATDIASEKWIQLDTPVC